MPSTTRFRSFPGARAKKIHNLSSDSIYLMLTNVEPAISNTVKSNLTEIAAGGGYTANGFALTRTSFDHGASTGIWRLFLQTTRSRSTEPSAPGNTPRSTTSRQPTKSSSAGPTTACRLPSAEVQPRSRSSLIR